MMPLLLAAAFLLLLLLPLVLLRWESPRPAPLPKEELTGQANPPTASKTGEEARPPSEPSQRVTPTAQPEAREPSGAFASAQTPEAPPSPEEPENRGLRQPAPLTLGPLGKGLDVLLLIAIFPLGGALAIAGSFLLSSLARMHARSFPRCILLFLPEDSLYFMPSMYLGPYLAALLMWGCVRVLLGRRYVLYSHWWQGKLNCHGKQGIRKIGVLWLVLVLVTGLPATVSIPLMMNWHTRFEAHGIAIRPWFSVRETFHSYDTVDRILYIDYYHKDNKVIGSLLYLHFTDGDSWTSENLLVERSGALSDLPDFLYRKWLFNLLSYKTGREVERVEHWRGPLP